MGLESMCPRTGPDLPDGGIVRELMARQVDRRKALLIEALYAVDTDEVLLMMKKRTPGSSHLAG